MNLTEKAVERFKPSSERQTYRDDEQTGFGLRIEPADRGARKSFFFNAKIGGQVVFKALGVWPTMSVKAARGEAAQWAGKADTWKKAGFPIEGNPFAKPKKLPRTTVPSFEELAEAYIERHLLNPEEGALNKKRAEYDTRLLIRNFFSEWLDTPIDKITEEMVIQAREKAEGRYWQNSVVEFVRRVFNWSNGLSKKSRDKIVFYRCANPAQAIGLNKKKARDRFLQPEELLRLNEALKSEETDATTRDVVMLLLATGARRGNVFSMKWDDIDVDLGIWHVPMSKSGDGYDVPLTPVAVKTLEGRRELRKSGEQFVFPSSRAECGHITEIKKKFKLLMERAGIKNLRPHDARRTKGSFAALAGESLPRIGQMLGHKSIGATAVYARLLPQAARETSQASDEFMLQKMREAKKRLKKQNGKPKLLKVANG